MPLSISKAFRNGFRHAFSKNGIALMVFAVFFMSVSRVTSSVLFTKLLGQESFLATGSIMAQMASLPTAVLGLITAIAFTLVSGFAVVAIRTLTHDVTHMIPLEFIERNILRSTLNLMIGGMIFWILMGLGLILLIIPGLFIASLLLYFQFYVAVEDENFIEAMRKSVGLTSGNRLKNFGLITLLFITFIVSTVLIAIVIKLVLGIGTLLTLGLDLFLQQIYKGGIYGITMIVSIAIYADAYKQLN